MRIKTRTLTLRRCVAPLSLCLPLIFAVLAGRPGLGQSNPVLTSWLSNVAIQVTASNDFAGARYDLFTVAELPAIGDIPWTLCHTGAVGQTNFSIPFGPNLTAFFVVGTNDLDGDALPNFEDGNPTNSAIAILSIYIQTPTNGATIY